MSRLTRDGTAEPVARDQILRHVRGQGNIHFPYSADHEQEWQPYQDDAYSAICHDHTYIHRYSVVQWVGRQLTVVKLKYSRAPSVLLNYFLFGVRGVRMFVF